MAWDRYCIEAAASASEAVRGRDLVILAVKPRDLTGVRDEIGPALEKAIEDPRPALIDFRVEPEENVAPMVPAGAAIDEFELV